MPEETPNAFQLLSAAVCADNVAETIRLLHDHPDLTHRLDDPLPDAPFGGTALLRAAGARNREMIDVLLAHGADIDARSHWWAGSFGVLDHHSGLEDFLIERGATVDAHAAARLGKLDRLRELVEADASVVHASGGDGQTPLHFAATIGIAAFLLDRGADIDARDIDNDSTPAQYMIDHRQDVARYLVSRGCKTDILMAAALGDLDGVKRHLASDPASIETTVDPNHFPMRNPRAGGTIYNWTLGRSKTAHTVAKRFGREEVLAYLLDVTPAPWKLVAACEVGDEDLVRSILKSPPPIQYTGRLTDAARENNTTAVRLMLVAGWPVAIADTDGVTALHWAGFHGNSAMAGELLSHGAPLDARDRNHDGTPLDWAEYGSRHGWYRETGDYPAVIAALRSQMAG